MSLFRLYKKSMHEKFVIVYRKLLCYDYLRDFNVWGKLFFETFGLTDAKQPKMIFQLL